MKLSEIFFVKLVPNLNGRKKKVLNPKIFIKISTKNGTTSVFVAFVAFLLERKKVINTMVDLWNMILKNIIQV